MRYLKAFLTAITMMLWAPSLLASTVVGIVSERSAAEMAAGAHRFLDRNHLFDQARKAIDLITKYRRQH